MHIWPTKATVGETDHKAEFWVDSSDPGRWHVYFRILDTDFLGINTDERVSLVENSFATFLGFPFYRVENAPNIFKLKW